MSSTDATIRHEDADTRLVSIERSDAIDAAGALLREALRTEKDARARRLQGDRFAGTRRGMREQARVYRSAARRLQAAADREL